MAGKDDNHYSTTPWWNTKLVKFILYSYKPVLFFQINYNYLQRTPSERQILTAWKFLTRVAGT